MKADEGAAAFDARQEAAVEFARFGFEQAAFGSDAGGGEHGQAFARHLRVGVGDGGDDARYARLYQGFGAGRGAAVVAAWFEGNVGGGAARVFARLAQGVDFGMGAARFEVEALADDLAAVCDDAADARVG